MRCASEALWLKPTLSRYIYYKLMTLIPVSAAVIGLIRHGGTLIWAGLYLGLCLVHAAVMNAVKCPHCAYYKLGNRSFSCFIWWKTPKLYKERSGPESRFVAIYAPIGMLVLSVYPTLWLWREWELLLLYVLSLVVLVLSIGHNACTHCLNFECGHNAVPKTIRDEFLSQHER